MFKTQRRWSLSEDAILRAEVELQSTAQEGKSINWNQIAKRIPGRSNKDCRKRFYNEVTGGLKKGPWTEEEDSKLAILVARYGVSWVLVAQEMETRSAEQCSKRWQHHLNPNLNRSTWTDEENRCLLSAVHTHGSSWKDIQTLHFPARSANNVKNQHTIIKRKYVEVPSDLPRCCPITGAEENNSQYEDNEEIFDGVNPDFSELMDFDKAMDGGPPTSGMALSHVEKAIDSLDMDLYSISSETPRSESGLPSFGQSGGALTHNVYTPFSNRSDNSPGPGPSEYPLLGSPEFQVFGQHQSYMSLDNMPNQRSSFNAHGEQNLPYDAHNVPVPNLEGYELVDSVGGPPLRASNSRTIITLEEADQNTVVDMINIALRSKAKVKFENY